MHHDWRSLEMTLNANPYAPPTAAVADPSRVLLQKRSVVLMIVLTILTVGFYLPIWFLRRREALNQLDSPRKLQVWPFAAVIAVMTADLFVNVLILVQGPGAVSPEVALIIALARLGFAINLIVQCFKTKDILEDHLAGPADGMGTLFTERVKLSGLMTFFFQPLYLQYIINRDIVGREQLR
jgi:hypothetical protein